MDNIKELIGKLENLDFKNMYMNDFFRCRRVEGA